MKTERESRLAGIAVVVLLSIAGIFGAMALIKIFGDFIGFAVLVSFVALTLYAWHHTDSLPSDDASPLHIGPTDMPDVNSGVKTKDSK